MIDYGLTLLTGLLASLHCVGMCGAIVLAYSMPGRDSGARARSPFVLHLAYNGGRIASYAILGAAIALLGVTLSGFESVAGAVAVVSGIVMVIAGLAMLGVLPFSSRIAVAGSGAAGPVTRLTGSLIRGRSALSKFSLGLLSPLLPCGILYAMLAKAAAAGSTLDGAVTMALFAAGMSPSLVALGAFTSFFSARVRRGAMAFAAATIVLMGVTLVLRGLHVPFAGFLPMGGMAGGGHPGCCTP